MAMTKLAAAPATRMLWTKTIMMFTVMMMTMMSTSSSSSSSSANARRIPKFDLPGITPDPWVALAAPLIVGVVCQDAVLLLAVHTSFATTPPSNDDDNHSNNNNDESFLLYGYDDADKEIDGNGNNENNNNSPLLMTSMATTTDLPKSYRGPFRIFPLPSSDSALVCTGWRTDGQALADHLRSVERKELEQFGPPPHTNSMGSSGHGSSSCSGSGGYYLADQAALYMAMRSLPTTRSRPLRTVGLLASASSSSSGTNGSAAGGALWLVDATGAYRVRAHAVGGATIAGPVNVYLQQGDWTKKNCKDVAKELLSIVFDDQEEETSDDENRTGGRVKVDVPKGSRVEIMSVGGKGDKGNRRLKRLFSSTLFGTPKASS